MYRRADGVYADQEYAKPITIGDNCWLAGNVTVCGGVTIGSGTVIGAGSVVTHDIPAGVLAAGVPCGLSVRLRRKMRCHATRNYLVYSRKYRDKSRDCKKNFTAVKGGGIG